MLQDVIDLLLSQNMDSIVHAFWFVLFVEIPRFTVGGFCFLLALWVRRKISLAHPPAHPYAVSVVVPAHNSADSLARTIFSLKEQRHASLQVIVVNDGSTDHSHALCLALQKQGHIDDYIELKSRGGKSAAVNVALSRVKHPYFMVTDADTTYDNDAIWRACRYFQDPTVGAVSGNLQVRNWAENNVTHIQQINYFFSIYLGRLVRDSLRFYFVASGAFSLFRTEVVKQLGQWDFGPGEDGDISTRIRIAGYQVRFAHLATAQTHVPSTWPGLANQRLRWDRSMIRLRFRKYRERILNPFYANFRPLLALSFFDIYWFQGLVPFLFYAYVLNLWREFGAFSLVIMLSVQLCYMMIDAFKLACVLLFLPRQHTYWRLAWYIPLYSLSNIYFLRLVKLLATISELIWRGSYQDDYVPQKIRNRVLRY
jgi:biofilm PGA synthesis N-glycosyltransferase PgaC